MFHLVRVLQSGMDCHPNKKYIVAAPSRHYRSRELFFFSSVNRTMSQKSRRLIISIVLWVWLIFLVAWAKEPPALGQNMPYRALGEEDKDHLRPTASFWKAFVSALSMIFISELGDKTFLITAIMATKNKKYVVFSASLLSLALMTVISVVLGALLFRLVPALYTKVASAILFFIFGLWMLHDGWNMKKSTRSVEDVQEVCSEIESLRSITIWDSPSGEISGASRSPSPPNTAPLLDDGPPARPTFLDRAVLSLKKMFHTAFFQVAGLCFLAEWGDRSQLAIIPMAASGNVYGVVSGAILGHSICTLLAVVAGSLIAYKLSVRYITLMGGLLFMGFCIWTIVEIFKSQ